MADTLIGGRLWVDIPYLTLSNIETHTILS
ncbi:unnamed protein product [Fusarium venenatum]|uniref:Uncharacterized protein n=1 Tax=Fusarium venenatum TaxID=56646 RepID=A0A2L2SNS0_9HYPO|nr:uncharacterized protein FVRRES_11955 [Fusarium venenatum]CEI39264.1 unnamed protein product [Fusarium venenatum]